MALSQFSFSSLLCHHPVFSFNQEQSSFLISLPLYSLTSLSFYCLLFLGHPIIFSPHLYSTLNSLYPLFSVILFFAHPQSSSHFSSSFVPCHPSFLFSSIPFSSLLCCICCHEQHAINFPLIILIPLCVLHSSVSLTCLFYTSSCPELSD